MITLHVSNFRSSKKYFNVNTCLSVNYTDLIYIPNIKPQFPIIKPQEVNKCLKLV